ncbi:hypothetical protein CNR22_00220 [Sphingobacteriaceae bacterium]|nr:hypothetical protein CNR22_00220 [Sphingobacteriaceae bacterium]
MRSLALLILCSILYSCEKKELPIPKREVITRGGGISQPGELIDMQVAMETDYKNQIWFSLNESKVMYTNLKSDWDITFECSSNGFHVMLNGSKSMKAFKTTYAALEEVSDTAGIGSTGKADMPSGTLDSTAIGDWVKDNKVYIINRGYNEKGQHQGYYKLKLLSVNATEYTFEYSTITNPKTMQGTITKNSDCNFVAYSFSTNQACANIEPKKQEYDICFTQYTHYFNEEKMYYLVTGALVNNYNTRVIKLKDKAFADITIKDTINRPFSIRRDVIGYDWKDYNLNTNVYTTYPQICYIISDSRGYFYKLHFIDFLKSGVKGYPTFQFQKL